MNFFCELKLKQNTKMGFTSMEKYFILFDSFLPVIVLVFSHCFRSRNKIFVFCFELLKYF